ncbi:MAG TPA: FkbM family methyltransferase [Bryobacteraceae bacterium]|nr:FkbM family methyltransferase [Bryobacteraceae bacterium]
MKQFYSKFISPGDLVFDIGANRGDRTELFVQMNARVVAVEPIPGLASRLQSIFRYSPVSVEAAGVGSRPGTLPLHVCSASECSSFSDEFVDVFSQKHPSFNWDAVELVPIVTMDALLRKHGPPAFAKVDVEGYEREVLAGLTIPVPALSFEVRPYDSITTASTVSQHLARLARYEFNLSLEESFVYVLPQWVDGDSLLRALRDLPPDSWNFLDVYARRTDV